MTASALTGALRGKITTIIPENADQGAGKLPAVPLEAFPCLRPLPDGPAKYEKDDSPNSSKTKTGLSRAPSLSTEARDYSHEEQRWEKLGSQQLAASFMSALSLEALPKPMTLEQRAAAKSASVSSLSVSQIKTLPPEKVAARSAEGRRLRRRLLKDVVVVFVVAGYQGKRFIYERAKELGVRSVVLDNEDCWAAGLVEEGLAEMFIPIDFEEQEGLFERVLAGIRQAEQRLGAVDAVTSFWELAQPLVSRLAEALGLQANPPRAVDVAREKQETRRVMAEAGLPTPANMVIRGPEDLAEASERVGFPAVLKPISGGGSLGVKRVNSAEELEREYARGIKEMGSVVRAKDGNLVTQDDGGTTGKKGVYVAVQFMLEQYLDGPEVDVDLVFNNGEVVYGAITDNWPTIEPYFNETGSNCPSTLPPDQQQQLCQLSVAASKALGFQLGVLHVEAKFTSHGPHLIEINSRMGGGGVYKINKLVWGIDLVEEQLLAACSIPSQPYLPDSPLCYLAEYSVNAKTTGILQNDDFLEEVLQDPELIYANVLVSPGSKVVCAEDGLPTWLFEVCLVRPSLQEAIDAVKAIEVETEAKIKILPLSGN
eukprot:jgi/Botrbrau1/2766/Bobra.0164s0043.1